MSARKRTLALESNEDHYALLVLWADAPVDRYRLPKEIGPLCLCEGAERPLEELQRIEELQDRGPSVVIAVRYEDASGRMVRRDCHVILTEGLTGHGVSGGGL